MKNQNLFSSKDKSKKLNCRLLQFLFGALRVKSSSTHKIKYADVLLLISFKTAKASAGPRSAVGRAPDS